MQKVKNFWGRIKNWSLTRKIIYSVILIVLILVVYGIFKPKDNSANITTDTAKIINLKQTVLATGQVTSNIDLDLSFFGSGVVRSMKVKVGDEVKTGQILATLDQGNELGALTSAKGAVAAAEAKYQKILAGASNEEIKLSQVALDNAKNDFERVKLQQKVLVENAYNAMLSNNLVAVPSNSSIESVEAPTISGTYEGGVEGDYVLSIPEPSSFVTAGIETSTGKISSSTPIKLGTKGLFIQFPSNFNSNSNTQWTISIPNKKSSTYVTYYNAYQSALKTQDSALGVAQALIDQREAELSLKKATARSVDLDLAKADILSAEGQLQLASANFEHTILRAPANGTITKVDIKIGELAQALKNVISLQDVKNIYLEADINEANITSIKLDAPIDITFDAFGAEKVFKGKIIKIDPSSTIISGVVNYKVTANIIDAPELRPGMTANMTILVGEKNNILSIPSRAILKDKTGKKTVRLITDPKTKEYKEIEVTTGMEGDGGITEIINGLKEGEEIVVLIKS